MRKLVGVEPITTGIRSGRLRWYAHVVKKGGEDWVKKCVEFGVEGRRPVGKTGEEMVGECGGAYGGAWDRRGGCHGTGKWRRSIMKRKSNHIVKQTIN